MGGFSGSGGGGQFGQFINNLFPNLGGQLNGLFGRLGQNGQQGQQNTTPTMPGGTPQQTGGSAYPGFQMPAFTYHRSMPQFNFSNSTYQPAAGMDFYGGALNLPGWAMQQNGQAGGNATGWRPNVGTQTPSSGSGNGNYSNDPFRQLMTQGYAYIPGQGMATLDPQWFSPEVKSAAGPLDLRKDSDWQKIYG